MLEATQQRDTMAELERLDLAREIPTLDIPLAIRDQADPRRRRVDVVEWIENRIKARIAPPVSATSLCVEQPNIRVLVLEIARRYEIVEGQLTVASRALRGEMRCRLATIDGRPLASHDPRDKAHLRGVKVGQRDLSADQARSLEARGGSINLYAEYPAEFDVDIVDAVRILSLYGWRTARRQEDWIVYEVGGPIVRELALWLAEQGNAERARAICPAAFGEAEPVADDEPAARRRGR